MKPSDICNQIIGNERLTAILDKLSSPQIKAVIKEGDLHPKLPSGYVAQQKRRDIFHRAITTALAQENQPVAAELLQQWLLNHRRPMLIDLLERLEVRHRQGETDESFLIARPAEKVREAAAWLLGKHDRIEVIAYLRYIAFQQRANCFDGWEPLEVSTSTGADASAATEAAAPAEAPATTDPAQSSS